MEETFLPMLRLPSICAACKLCLAFEKSVSWRGSLGLPNRTVLTWWTFSKRMVLHAVQINRYKNGLFVTSITPRSELLNDMNVFINSAQVTGLDNLRIVNIKEGIERIYSAIRQGNEVKSIYGREMWAVDIEASWMLSELTVSMPRELYVFLADSSVQDVLNSTDKHEHARWLEIYGNP